jgi:hypothetical protein
MPKVIPAVARMAQHRVGKVVTVDGPLQLGDAGVERTANGLDGKIDHRAVELGDQHREASGRERQPAPGSIGTMLFRFCAAQDRVPA